MLLRNVHTGAICTEKDLVIHWEMDMTYEYLNREDLDDEEGEDEEPEMTTFSDWLKEMIEDGDYEIVG